MTLCPRQSIENRIPKGASIAPAHDGAPWALTRARGGHDPESGSYKDGTLLVCVKQPHRKTKTTERNDHKHPCHLASREKASDGASNLKPPNVPRQSETTQECTRPGMAPRQTRERKDARPKQVITQSGIKQKKETDQKRAVWGVPCDYLNFISQKKGAHKTTS